MQTETSGTESRPPDGTPDDTLHPPMADAPKRPGLTASLLPLLKQPNFLVVVLVLAVAAAGLNASVQFLELHFKKEPVPMSMKFADAMPPVLGNWVRVAKNDTIDSETLAALGTEEFLFCSYVNAKDLAVSVEELKRQFENKGFEEQYALMKGIQQDHPTSVLQLSMTYYTGKADTVAHIPERCYVGNGFDPVDPRTETWELGARPGPGGATAGLPPAATSAGAVKTGPLDVRHITFEDNVGRSLKPHNVAYFFHVNGSMTPESLAVRRALQDLRTRHGYYAKMELMTITLPFRSDMTAQKEQMLGQSKASMKEFLSLAVPHFEKAMPDWSKYAR